MRKLQKRFVCRPNTVEAYACMDSTAIVIQHIVRQRGNP